ncbi:MAG: hypothetical protein HQL78_11905 [Magnetococcales bacterium]|nr:hypothetical protein [Magnetococcales bacterium]
MPVFDHPIRFIETVRENKWFLFSLFILSSILFLASSLAWPIRPGSALDEFLDYYYNQVRTLRTIGSSMILGSLLESGYAVVNGFIYVAYIAYLFSSFYIARLFGITFARIAVVLIVLHVQVAVFFHFFSSDMLTCVTTALWAALMVRFHAIETWTASIFMGLTTFSLVLIRPVSLLFVLFAIYPIICRSWSLRNLGQSLAFILAFVIGFASYASYNYFNYGFFGMIHSSYHGNTNALFPGMSLFLNNPMYERTNGPYSEQLFALVETKVIGDARCSLCIERNLTVDGFFKSKRLIDWATLLAAAEEFSPGLLRKAALEAIAKHPVQYFTRSVIFPAFHLSNKEIEIELSLPDVAGNQNKTMEVYFQDYPERYKTFNTIKYMSSQKENYYLAFFFKYFLFKLLPPMMFFILASFLIVFNSQKEYRLLLALLLPLFATFFVHIHMFPSTRLRLPYDFLFIIGGLSGLIGNRFPKDWFFQRKWALGANHSYK